MPLNSPIKISEDIKFHHKLTIMIFWTKFAQVKTKIASLRATAIATYYIKLIREETGETITGIWEYLLFKLHLLLKNHNFGKNL